MVIRTLVHVFNFAFLLRYHISILIRLVKNIDFRKHILRTSQGNAKSREQTNKNALNFMLNSSIKDLQKHIDAGVTDVCIINYSF